MTSADRVAVMLGSMNEAQAKLARYARALNMRHARGRALPAVVLMTDDTREVDWLAAVAALLFQHFIHYTEECRRHHWLFGFLRRWLAS